MKNKAYGFNIIELMVAISIGALLIATMVESYASLYKSYAFNIKYLTVNHDMRLALQVMENDINDAGVFGSYSLHNSSSDTFQLKSFSGGNQCSSPWCKVDIENIGVGITSSKSDIDNVTGGVSLAHDSDIVKVQHGSDEMLAYAIAKDVDKTKPMVSRCSSGMFSNRFFLSNVLFSDLGIDKSAGFYVLSSANEAYLINKSDFISSGKNFVLNFTDAIGCPSGGGDYIEAHSNINSSNHDVTKGKLLQYDSIDPDIHSMTLTNLITNYYFVSTENGRYKKGLYRVSSLGNKISELELISDKVDQIKLTYLLDFAPTLNKSGASLSDRYTICTTDDMLSGRSDCKSNWDKVVAVTIDLTTNDNPIEKPSDNIKQTVRDTISWKS